MSTYRTARGGVVHAVLVMLLLVTGAVALTVPTAAPAQALCAAQPTTGDWRNIDPNTRSVTRVTVGFHCGDVVLCPVGQPCTGGQSYVTVNPYGKCHPTDCNWGLRRAEPMGDGWHRAIYTHSWSTKYVWVKTYEYYGLTYLRVYVWTDFTAADGRTDYASDQWMLK